MKNIKIFGIALTVILSVYSVTTAQADRFNAKQIVKQANEYLNELVKENRFSGTVLLARNGKVVLSKGYGLANRETDTPNTVQSKIRIASLTKQFTAVGILMLQEKGKLSVSDSLCKYIENCPQSWQAVTLHHLLTHTSGITTRTNYPADRKPLTRLESIVWLKSQPMDAEPGREFNYNNSGYVLLGLVIEKVSGQLYAEFLRENIFAPLKMTNTDYDFNAVVVPNRASGYAPTKRGVKNSDYIDMNDPFSAGGLYSTAEDLYRWQQGLANGRLISPKSLAAMTEPFKENYGYGVFIEKQYDLKVITHGGAINGAATVMTRFPDENAVVIVLSNIEGVFAGGYGKRLAGILLGDKLDLPKVVKADPATFKQYEGRYQVRPETPTEDVFTQNGKLKIKISGNDEIELLPVGRDEFVMSHDFEARYVFNRVGGGEVTGSTFHYGKTYSREVKRLAVVPNLNGNTTFRLKNFPNARYVNLAGSFNDWKSAATACGRDGADWICRIDLKPGKYFYKFIVDGEWMTDPENSQTENDGNDNINSVKIVS